MKKTNQNRLAQRACLRVVHLTTAHQSGDPRIFHKQLKTLSEAGYQAHLIAPHPRAETVSGIPIHALPQIGGRYRRVILQRQAYSLARHLDAECYHIHDPELIPLAYLLKQAAGARVVYDMHEDYRWHGSIEGRLIRKMEQWCFRWADHVVLAEPSYAPVLRESDVKHTIIRNYARFYDDGGACRSARSAMRPLVRLLYTGVVSEARGVLHMIDLISRCHVEGLHGALDIVGICNYPDQRARVEKRIKQQNLAHRIRRVGWDMYVPTDSMTPYYQAADVGLALFKPKPNYVHSLPTKFFEYLHFGLPILCSDFPLWRQFIERHSCGAVVPPGDSDAAVAVLRHWCNQPDQYSKVVSAARVASTHYQWDDMGERLVQLYDGLLGVREADQ